MAGNLSIAATGLGGSGQVQQVGSGKDLKLQRIINKFKAGKKLTSGELTYLAEKAPEMYQKVLRIMQKREQLEKRLEEADSKEEVQSIMMQEMQSIENFCASSDDDFEKTALVNQMMDAYGKAVQSSSYKEKPDTEFTFEEEFMNKDMPGQAKPEQEKLEQENPEQEKLKKERNLSERPQGGVPAETMSAGNGIFPEEGTDPVSTDDSLVAGWDNQSPTATKTGTFEAVAYNSKGNKKRAFGSSGSIGAKVNIAI